MRERRYVKIKTDMYEDTKSKIIDMKPERDLIHYVWSRVIILAGKVNLEGNLYMSKNIPYTIETLAIEFNRDNEQIKLALDVFIELEMVEITDGNIYRVKNFAKHQNIKVKEKINSQDKEGNIKNVEISTKGALQNEVCSIEEKKSNDNEKEYDNKVVENEETDIRNQDKKELEITGGEIGKAYNISSKTSESLYKENITIPSEINKNKKATTGKKKEELFNLSDLEDIEDDEMFCFTEGERPLGEGEQIILEMTF